MFRKLSLGEPAYNLEIGLKSNTTSFETFILRAEDLIEMYGLAINIAKRLICYTTYSNRQRVSDTKQAYRKC